ncbi:MAG: phosphoribosyltransferase family protein [Actinomycetaceae bacterium]|nr:phosphoribosyltransferase family protein [Actinomycetaceae bacterium]
MNTFLKELANVVAPVSCAGCDAWDTALCAECMAIAKTEAKPGLVDGEDPMRLIYLSEYEGAIRSIILAAKNDRSRNLHAWLREAGYSLGRGWLAHRAIVDVPLGGAPLFVVPAPSQWTRAWRGMMITPTIAQGVTEALREEGVEAVTAEVLAETWGASQAGRSADQRRTGREAAIRALVNVRGANCVLVDDVVTTGATMLSCRSALEAASGHCFVGLALAKVPNLSRTRVTLVTDLR